jgi:hypothetical protein
VGQRGIAGIQSAVTALRGATRRNANNGGVPKPSMLNRAAAGLRTARNSVTRRAGSVVTAIGKAGSALSSIGQAVGATITRRVGSAVSAVKSAVSTRRNALANAGSAYSGRVHRNTRPRTARPGSAAANTALFVGAANANRRGALAAARRPVGLAAVGEANERNED